MSRTERNRECVGCGELYAEEFPWRFDWARGFCSKRCSRKIVSVGDAAPRKPISPASPAQRASIRDRACIVDASHPGPMDPAHLIARGPLTVGQEEELAVVPLCRRCHDAYDQARTLDLLPYLEPHWRENLAFAVARYGLLPTLKRVTNAEHIAWARSMS